MLNKNNIREKINKFGEARIAGIYIIITALVWIYKYYINSGRYNGRKVITLKMSGVSNILTIVFGITGGLLALLGLLSIFVSITTQQNIEKCREITWELEELKDKYNSSESKDKVSKISFEFLRLANSYKRVISPHNRITSEIISVSRITIYLVTLVWLAIVVFYDTYNVNINLTSYVFLVLVSFSGIFVLLKFSNILYKLDNFQNNIELPNASSFYDIKNTKFPVLYYVASHMRITQINEGENLKVIIPQGYKNFYVELVACQLGYNQYGNFYFNNVINKDKSLNEQYINSFKPLFIGDNESEFTYPLRFEFQENSLECWDIDEQFIKYNTIVTNSNDYKVLPQERPNEVNIEFKPQKLCLLFRLVSYNKEMPFIYTHYIIDIVSIFGLMQFLDRGEGVQPNNFYEGQDPLHWWKNELKKNDQDIRTDVPLPIGPVIFKNKENFEYDESFFR